MAIDLRSDTVTQPSQGMRDAIAHAPVGDDVYGDDPTVNSLESRVAEMFGMEAGVFTPSGSLANQLAIRMLVAPGEELLAESNSHIVRAELGAAAVFSGITTRTWQAVNGRLKASAVIDIARPDSGPYLVSTTAIAVENTHNFGGGTVQSIKEIADLRAKADELGLRLHLDGARIWNAHIASGVSFLEYGKYFDTVSVCLSKGLGAPVGSVMISTQERISKARVWRKRYGAGMRQVGILAAAGHYALDNNLERLADDHRRAKKLAVAIAAIDSTLIDPSLVETNIVGLDLTSMSFSAADLAKRTREAGLWISSLGPHYARLVTHLDFDDAQCEEAIEILKIALVTK
ncbi:MAG: GntG family PLP-dependent aldolase [Candidatus Planktophila sp.]|nr:GntG family PLP-dependent aldolase [Candidatus Planktophila sp.]